MPVGAQGYATQVSDTTKDAHSYNDVGKKNL
jgi:hypothetical protein